jgi:hypothetical protein
VTTPFLMGIYPSTNKPIFITLFYSILIHKANKANIPTSPQEIRMSVLMAKGEGLRLIRPLTPGMFAAQYLYRPTAS